MSIWQNVSYGPRIHGLMRDAAEMEAHVEDCLRRAHLWDEVKDRLHTLEGTELSGGQQQRLCIARALSTKPDVLLMDEPTGSIDPIATQKVEELVMELKADKAIILVTHSMMQARRADRRPGWRSRNGRDAGHLGRFIGGDRSHGRRLLLPALCSTRTRRRSGCRCRSRRTGPEAADAPVLGIAVRPGIARRVLIAIAPTVVALGAAIVARGAAVAVSSASAARRRHRRSSDAIATMALVRTRSSSRPVP
jgi:hypothetical protein